MTDDGAPQIYSPEALARINDADTWLTVDDDEVVRVQLSPGEVHLNGVVYRDAGYAEDEVTARYVPATAPPPQVVDVAETMFEVAFDADDGGGSTT